MSRDTAFHENHCANVSTGAHGIFNCAVTSAHVIHVYSFSYVYHARISAWNVSKRRTNIQLTFEFYDANKKRVTEAGRCNIWKVGWAIN